MAVEPVPMSIMRAEMVARPLGEEDKRVERKQR